MLKTHKAVILKHIALYYPAYSDQILYDFEVSKFRPRFRISFRYKYNSIQIWEPTRKEWENIHNFNSQEAFERFMVIQKKHVKKMVYKKEFGDILV